MIAWLLFAVAQAQPCAPLTNADMAGRVRAAEAALDRDDVIGHGALWRELQADLLCMQGVVHAEEWAKFLVTLAVVEFALGQGWEEPLSTAQAAFPHVDLGGAPPALRGWTSPPSEPGPAFRDGARWYVDGLPATHAPASGLHLVQRERSGVWETRLVRNQPVPEAWIALAPSGATATPSRKGPASLQVGASGGFAALAQRVSEPGDHLGDYRLGRGAWGGSATAAVPIGGLLVGGAASAWMRDGIGGEAWGGLGAGGRAYAWAGAGAMSVSVVEGGEVRRLWAPQIHAVTGVALPLAGASWLDLGAHGGGSWAGAHGGAQASWVGGVGATRWSIGAKYDASVAFMEEDAGDRTARAASWRAGLVAGLAWGDRGGGDE